MQPLQPIPLNIPPALRSRVKAAMLGVTEAGVTAVQTRSLIVKVILKPDQKQT